MDAAELHPGLVMRRLGNTLFLSILWMAFDRKLSQQRFFGGFRFS